MGRRVVDAGQEVRVAIPPHERALQVFSPRLEGVEQGRSERECHLQGYGGRGHVHRARQQRKMGSRFGIHQNEHVVCYPSLRDQDRTSRVAVAIHVHTAHVSRVRASILYFFQSSYKEMKKLHPASMWKGPTRKADANEQAYYTGGELASQVVNDAVHAAPEGALFVDVGAGDGALFSRLPYPKHGIELTSRAEEHRLRGVDYETDVFTWMPPEDWASRDVVVVMNPPFARQVPILNCVAKWKCKSLCVVWIAGLNIRHWMHEDAVDDRLHLEREWIVPPEWSGFATKCGVRHIRTAVQVWRRDDVRRRALWKDTTLQPDIDFCVDVRGSVIVTRLNSPSQVGRAGLVGRDVHMTEGRAVLTARGRRTLGGRARAHGSEALGTTGKTSTSGTTMRLSSSRPEELVRLINERRAQGAFRDLLKNRSWSPGIVTLSATVLRWILAPEWRTLDERCGTRGSYPVVRCSCL